MIRSAQFDDIYFSADNGLAETDHVFLRGNNLPAAWQHRPLFTIAETGFGTGLNFLAACKLFEETAPVGHQLDYVSFEKYPLSAQEIAGALQGWQDYFGDRLAQLVKKYPLRINGFHRVHISPRIRLTLIFDDVNEALPRLVVPCGINAWFLDGFAPAKNPQMWSETLFKEMARLSAPAATAASFTAAGFVRRGLAAQGFAVSKVPGYGRKRDMTQAIFTADTGREQSYKPVQRVAILGGGLAGTSCAQALLKRGIAVTIFDPHGLAQFASGNPVGIYNPRFSQNRSPESDVYSSGYAALAALNQSGQRCGSLHLVRGEDKAKRFRGMKENWGWHDDHVRWLSAAEASAQAGVALSDEALFLPDSGYVSPRRLCLDYAAGVTVKADGLIAEDYDALILANGIEARRHPLLAGLPLQTIRGQISFLEAVTLDPALTVRSNICYGGYLSATNPEGYVAGATFQQWLTDTDVKDSDHQDILENLAQAVPALAGSFRVTGGRAALRCASKDRFPVIGAPEGEDRVYVTTAHGSHGLVTSLAGAEYLADRLSGTVWSLPGDSAVALAPARFSRLQQKKGLPSA